MCHIDRIKSALVYFDNHLLCMILNVVVTPHGVTESKFASLNIHVVLISYTNLILSPLLWFCSDVFADQSCRDHDLWMDGRQGPSHHNFFYRIFFGYLHSGKDYSFQLKSEKFPLTLVGPQTPETIGTRKIWRKSPCVRLKNR